jgi:hypothetical protein
MELGKRGCLFYYYYTGRDARPALFSELWVTQIQIRYRYTKVNVPRDSHKSDSAVILNDI